MRPIAEPADRALRRVGRLLEPAGRLLLRGASVIAPYLARGAFGLLQLPMLAVSYLLDGFLTLGSWARALLADLQARITPVRALAAVTGLAAVALAGSQFVDYRGIAIGEPGYRGEIGVVAPAPETGREAAGAAHAYVLIPIALAALVLTVLTAGGRWRLGRWIAGLGILGIAVSLVVDLPKGLDEGQASVTFYGAEAQLIEGFWAQALASATLVACGLLLSAYAREEGR